MSGWVVRNNTFEQSAFDRSRTAVRTAPAGSATWATGTAGRASRTATTSAEVRQHADKAVSPNSSSAGASRRVRVGQSPALSDFHLKPGSPAIDAATPRTHPALDRDGLERDDRPDAGAHEFGAKPPGGTRRFIPGRRGPLVRSARLRARVICRRPTRRCPRATSVRLRVAEPVRVVMRLQRLRKGRKARTVRSVRRNVTTSASLRIRARGLRRGRYRAVLVATNGAGAKSRPRVFKLRVR